MSSDIHFTDSRSTIQNHDPELPKESAQTININMKKFNYDDHSLSQKTDSMESKSIELSQLPEQELIKLLALLQKQWSKISSVTSCIHVTSFLSGQYAFDNLNPMYEKVLDEYDQYSSLKKLILSDHPYIILLLVFDKTCQYEVEQINNHTKIIQLPNEIKRMGECVKIIAITNS